jgi:predicted secreted hydrolase
MPTRGALTVDGGRFDVDGTSWMDHEFGSSFLEKTQAGWDWFSLQLDDGADVMVFQLRGRDGSIDPRSSGTIVDAAGNTAPLQSGAFTLTAGRRWTSVSSGAAYPVEWRIDSPSSQLALAVTPVLDAQELHQSLQSGIAYWEGAVRVAGTHAGRAVTGRGYLEMTGYSGRGMGEFLGRMR